MASLNLQNYLHVYYLQQQQLQQLQNAQLSVLMAQTNAGRNGIKSVFGEQKKKLSFGMDTILGSPAKESDQSDSSDMSTDSGFTCAIPTSTYNPAMAGYPFIGGQQSTNQSYDRFGRLQKSKRNRTVFTNEQLDKLEFVFSQSKYLVGNERTALAAELNLNETQVKVWFQNRRIKYRKQNKLDKTDSASGHDSSNCSGSDEEIEEILH